MPILSPLTLNVPNRFIRYSSLLRAARIAGLGKIDVIVEDTSDQQTLLMILSAAPGVKPLEEAEAIDILRTRHRMPVRDIVRSRHHTSFVGMLAIAVDIGF